MFVPCILGSDKTMVSVGNGHTEYYPLYISSGITQNHVRRAHRNALTLIGLLRVGRVLLSHIQVLIYFPSSGAT